MLEFKAEFVWDGHLNDAVFSLICSDGELYQAVFISVFTSITWSVSLDPSTYHFLLLCLYLSSIRGTHERKYEINLWKHQTKSQLSDLYNIFKINWAVPVNLLWRYWGRFLSNYPLRLHNYFHTNFRWFKNYLKRQYFLIFIENWRNEANQ